MKWKWNNFYFEEISLYPYDRLDFKFYNTKTKKKNEITLILVAQIM